MEESGTVAIVKLQVGQSSNSQLITNRMARLKHSTVARSAFQLTNHTYTVSPVLPLASVRRPAQITRIVSASG